MNIYVRPSPHDPGSAVRLASCDNRRDFEGMPVPCPDGCLAHFDAWGGAESGIAYSPYPNSVQSWVAHLPTTERVRSWSSAAYRCLAGDDIRVRLFANRAAFTDQAGTQMLVFVVQVDGIPDGAHYVALFGSYELAATFFDHEVRTVLDDGCDCLSKTLHNPLPGRL